MSSGIGLVSLALGILREGGARSPRSRGGDVGRGSGVGRRRDEPGADAGVGLASIGAPATDEDPLKKLKIPEWDDAAVREALQVRKARCSSPHPISTALDDIAIQTYRAAPDDIARLVSPSRTLSTRMRSR